MKSFFNFFGYSLEILVNDRKKTNLALFAITRDVYSFAIAHDVCHCLTMI